MRRQIFRYVPGIDELAEERLKELGFYTGFVCPHGHVIRDVTDHWCYHCVHKIQTNVCGFDVNYLHQTYKVRYEALWRSIEVGAFSECWLSHFSKARICFPSYRSFKNARLSENASIHKLIYQCAWGDIGKGWVTRTCEDPNCFNPLHLRSSWNHPHPPKTISPFSTKFEYEKLMLAAQRGIQNLSVDGPMVANFKLPIAHPKYQKNLKEIEE